VKRIIKEKITPRGDAAWVEDVTEGIRQVREGGYAFQVQRVPSSVLGRVL